MTERTGGSDVAICETVARPIPGENGVYGIANVEMKLQAVVRWPETCTTRWWRPGVGCSRRW